MASQSHSNLNKIMAKGKTEKEKLVERAGELNLKVQDNDTVEQLKQAIAGAEAIEKVAQLEKDLKTSQTVNTELNKQLSLVDQEKKVGQPVIEIDSKKYAMPIAKMAVSEAMAKKLNISGKEVTRDQVKESNTLQKALLKIKSGFLVEQTEEKKQGKKD